MTDSSAEQQNTSSEYTPIITPYWKMFKKLVFGIHRPPFWTRLLVYLTMFVATVFEFWNTVSFLILKYPNYLKVHKQVDVRAIVELRGRELQFDNGMFIQKLELFHLIAIWTWLIIFLAGILLWRKIKYAPHLLISAWIVYCVALFWLLGTRYFVEDTTAFDKFFLILLFLCTLAHYVMNERNILKKQELEKAEAHDNNQNERIDGETILPE